jgi:hypothetical protein
VTCAGLGPPLAVSRLSRATRRSHGSLPQHVSRRASVPTAVRLPSPQGASERRDRERRDTLQRAKRARSVSAALLTELRGSPKRCGEPVFPRRRTGAPGQNVPCGEGDVAWRAICGLDLTLKSSLPYFTMNGIAIVWGFGPLSTDSKLST